MSVANGYSLLDLLNRVLSFNFHLAFGTPVMASSLGSGRPRLLRLIHPEP